MRKLLLILFLPSILFAQQIDGYLYADKVNFDTNKMIKYFTDNIKEISQVNGQNTLDIIIEKKLDRRYKTVMIDGYPVQFRRYGAKNYSLIDTELKVIRFDFVKKTVSKELVSYDDSKAFGKPDDLLIKVRKRNEKIRGKNSRVGKN